MNKQVKDDMALLTEGGLIAPRIYRHGPPDGGRSHCTEDL
jgi:hypothetical protein